MVRSDYRSLEAATYRHLYRAARWNRTGAEQLPTQPLSDACLARGRVAPATACNHA